MSIGLGIDSFAYHRWFGETTPWEKPLATRWTTDDFLDRAASVGVGAVSLQTIYVPELETAEGRRWLTDRFASSCVVPYLAWGHPDGLRGGTDPARFEALRHLLPVARDIGCHTLRLVCGNQFTRAIALEIRVENLVPQLQVLTDEAQALGLTLAIENHADLAMADLVSLVRKVDAPNLGICFDTGNAVRVGDDLAVALALAAPLIRMVHLKDMIVQPASRGDPTAWWPSVPIGRGEFDIRGFIATLRGANYNGALFVEMANMHPDFPDEDAAVADSLAYLRTLLACP